MNQQGNQEWQKSLGGDQADYLFSINLTRDGGYILGGSSYSDISGDKKEACRGLDDYWIIKLNAAGQEVWQKTIGGSGSDKLLSIQQTLDGGYIVGGSSDSPASFEKTESSQGSLDFWVLKLDANGKILWQKTIGGQGNDELSDMVLTQDGGCLLTGSSNSPQGGMKTVPNGEGSDIWVINNRGKRKHRLAENHRSRIDIVSKILSNKGVSFTLAGSSLSLNKKGETQSDYITVKLSNKGEILWTKKLGGDGRSP